MQLGLTCLADESVVAPTITWIKLWKGELRLRDAILTCEEGTELALRDLFLEIILGFPTHPTSILLHLRLLNLVAMLKAGLVALCQRKHGFLGVKRIAQITGADSDHRLTRVEDVILVDLLLRLCRLIKLFVEITLVFNQIKDALVEV